MANSAILRRNVNRKRNKQSDEKASLAKEIRAIGKLVTDNLLDKSEVSKMLQMLLAGKGKNNQSQVITIDDDEECSGDELQVISALASDVTYRNSKSPETLLIREMVEAPMKRRFEHECSLPETPLFGRTPPRRLFKPLFQRACQSPLKEILSRHHSRLLYVPTEKVSPLLSHPLNLTLTLHPSPPGGLRVQMEDSENAVKHVRQRQGPRHLRNKR